MLDGVVGDKRRKKAKCTFRLAQFALSLTFLSLVMFSLIQNSYKSFSF